MRASVLFGASCAFVAVLTIPAVTRAQDSTATDRPWYDRLSIRGYAQFRYNRLLETNKLLKCPTCDRSIGDRGGFFLRRARLAITAQVNDRLSVSIQPDFASEVGGRENTLVLRHDYADIYLDSARAFRARVGQSEVPTGFEALQSSSRRLPLDRAEAVEDGVDVGALVEDAGDGLQLGWQIEIVAVELHGEAARLHTRVITNPVYARGLVESLSDALASYASAYPPETQR